jgi:cellulose synthase/poly-beta-1,6-N-acetylglucosamine synthase-like glycosyltransferase
MARFDRIDYPRDRLDLCLILEEEDEVTRAAIAAAALPGWVQVIEVPSGSVRTKPRALNYALNFARGTIVGIWDAEDAPAPDQLRRVVQRFAERGPDVACLQGVLDYYNPRANWLARCFTLEYALWFRLLLPGVERLGLVVPLGGTTLFLRRHAIEAVCGWDAHNVTEDADLGVRLARAGFRTELLDTVTEEEANARLWPWVRQRSRWLKGYAVTWAVHMRRPSQLRREIGTRAFLGFQIQFLGTVLHYLTAPLLWGFWALALGIVPAPYGSAGGVAIRAALGFLLVAEVATMALAAVAVRRAGKPDVARWAPTLLFYFPLATIAAWKGLWEAILHPFFWDKTTHGFFPLPQAAPAPDVARAPAPPASDVTGPPASAPRRSSAG